MFLLVWGIFFIIALIPGGIAGWLIGKLPIAIGWTILLSVIVSGLIGFVVELIMSTDSSATTKRHLESMLTFAPPIAMAMFLGIFVARNLKKHTRPSPLDPKHWRE